MFSLQAAILHSENVVPMIPVSNDIYHQQPMSLPPQTTATSQIDQEFTQINQQFQDLSLQYQNPSYEYGNIGVDATQNQAAERNNFVDSSNQYAQQNLYETQQTSDFYGQTQQTEAIGNNIGGYADQQSQQMYQQQTYNDPMAYGTTNYGAAEVRFAPNKFTLNFLFRFFLQCIVFGDNSL